MKNKQKIQQMLSVYFIAGTQDCQHLAGNPAQNLLSILQQALRAGITCFQFRDKGKNSLENQPDQQKQLAKQCLSLCRQYDVPLIINDNVALAVEIGADGIHVGQTDMAIQQVLQHTQNKLIIGLSTNNLAQVLAAQQQAEIDYIGIGPIFPTGSKADHSAILSVEFVEKLKDYALTKPFVVIGGINQYNAHTLKQAGADGVAVISAITQAENIQTAVEKLKF
ncbi:thiamine phosphate synthase [Lonepinella sp. BR2930]|uniref:thiamine phosphate synthase n=1 Tax=Lonepinella sp. BR2930 TaxID=3434554 RepID=UPI003F6DC8E9